MAMGMTAPVVTGAAAGAGTAAGTVQGLDGLFAALLGTGFVQGDVSADMADILAQNGVGVAADGAVGAASAVPVENVLQLGDGPAVTVQGEQSVVAAFMVKVQELFDKFAKEGVMPRGSELAQALMQQGIPADVATQMAARIDTVMQMLDAQQDTDKDSENSIEAMMLAAMMAGQQGGFQIQIVQESRVDVRVQVDLKRFAAVGASSGDLARQMSDVAVGGKDIVPSAAGLPVADSGNVAAVAAPVVPETGTGVVERKGERQVRVEVTPSADGGVVRLEVKPVSDPVETVVMPGMVDPQQVAGQTDVFKAEPVRTDGRPLVGADASALTAVAAQVAAQAKPSLPVEEPRAARVEKVLEKVEGKTLYRWQADDKGHETMQVVGDVKPSSTEAGRDAAQQQAAAQAALAAVKGEGASADPVGFGDRLQMAAQARVVEQVTVQIRPLAEAGGGTVRMTLNPPELGQVQVDLTMKDGKVHGSISASDPAVVEHLARELHNLRHGLADAGLKLGEQGINLMLSDHGQQQQQRQGQQHAEAQAGFGGGVSRWGGEGEAEVAEVSAVEVAANWISPERLVDVRI